jgi:2-polyprenyl-3-methyl-5-hydroxy-6-metoxy-1,4-benzoquinol methylase
VNCPGCGGAQSAPVRDYLGTHEIFRRMNLARCAGCGLVFAQPQPSAAELADYYSHYWDGEVAQSTPSTRRYYLAQALSRIAYLRKFRPLEGASVLDMGAGLGLFHDAMQKSGIAHRYVAVETDRSQLAALRARLGEAHARLEELPPGEQFDIIVLAHVLEHTSEPHAFVESLMARLKPGGFLMVEVPNGDWRYKNNFESHLLFFDPASLRRALQDHGEVLDVSTVGKDAAKLRITQVHPGKDPLRPLKEVVKTAIALTTPDFDAKQVARYEMSSYGGDRQWLRAVLKRPG